MAQVAVGGVLGVDHPADARADRYLRHLSKASTLRLDGLTVVVDCAHGAASAVAPRG
ncbi:hypothetical protein MAHJHV54_47560 [Mycobacterium avium subsp. hominissuis]